LADDRASSRGEVGEEPTDHVVERVGSLDVADVADAWQDLEL